MNHLRSAKPFPLCSVTHHTCKAPKLSSVTHHTCTALPNPVLPTPAARNQGAPRSTEGTPKHQDVARSSFIFNCPAAIRDTEVGKDLKIVQLGISTCPHHVEISPGGLRCWQANVFMPQVFPYKRRNPSGMSPQALPASRVQREPPQTPPRALGNHRGFTSHKLHPQASSIGQMQQHIPAELQFRDASPETDPEHENSPEQVVSFPKGCQEDDLHREHRSTTAELRTTGKHP